MFDVIIIGAGPAGLSVGSELSKTFKVLIVDAKKDVAACTKSWFIPGVLVADNPDVMPFMTPGIKRLLCSTASGKKTCWETSLEGGYYYVEEHGLLKHWADRVLSQGSEILLETSYTDHQVSKDGVTVETTRGRYEAKFLIDASGHDSQVKKKYKDDQSYYWWSVYGALVDHPNGLHGMKNGDYMLWQTFKDTQVSEDTKLADGRPVFEYEVLSDQTSFPLILYLRESKVQVTQMEQEFMHVLYQEDATKPFHDAQIKERKWGWYPSGDLTVKQAEDRVDFIGDAGCWTTPCGWGFGFIVYNYRYYAQAVSACIMADTLDKKSLKDLIHFNFSEKHQILMDAIASHFLAHASPNQLDRFIDFFNSNDPLMCEKIFTLTINQEEIRQVAKKFVEHFEVGELLKIFPPKDYRLIAKELPYFLLDTAGEFMARKKEGDLKLKPGFDMSDNEPYDQ